MSANFHPLVYLVDYIMGMIMWTLIGRVAMNIFQREDSNFFFMKVFVKLTDPLINSFRVITPSFIIKPLVPLYVAWFFYMFRFYLMPYLMGYSVMGMLSFPLESEIAIQIYQIFGKNLFKLKNFIDSSILKYLMKKIQISPSILAADFSQLGEEISRLEKGGADMIHVDVMDGHFVPNLTIGPPVIKTLRNYTKLPFDVHLMISPVHKYIKNFAEAGSDIITIHPETTDNVKDSIKLIKSLNNKVGLSINPDVPLKTINNFLPDIDLVLVMSVFPGFGGQKFIPEVLDKIKNLNKIKIENSYNFQIEVDGGINFENSKSVIDAGADILVSGTTIFKDNQGDIKKNIDLLKNLK